MDDLFPDAPRERPLLPHHGDQATYGAWTLRNWHGWAQHHERGDRGGWRFIIHGFGDHDCAVVAFDAEGREITRDVPIDGRDRILIDGRRYGRNRWSH